MKLYAINKYWCDMLAGHGVNRALGLFMGYVHRQIRRHLCTYTLTSIHPLTSCYSHVTRYMSMGFV